MVRVREPFSALRHEQNPVSARTFDEQRFSLFLDTNDSHPSIEVHSWHTTRAEVTTPESMSAGVEDLKLEVGNYDDWEIEHPWPSPRKSDIWPQVSSLSFTRLDDFKYVRMQDRFQVYFVRQRHSYSPLSVTYAQFEALLKIQQVSPQFKDYILYMGERQREMEVVPPRLRWRRDFSRNSGTDVSTDECMYGLRYIELNGRGNYDHPTSRWSLRQTAVQCSYRALDNTAAWILIAPSQIAEARLNRHLSSITEWSTQTQFEIHLLLFDSAIANWRPYLVDIGAELDQHKARILGATPDDRGPITMLDWGQRQELLLLDQKLLNASVVIKSTSNNVRTLRGFHDSVRKKRGESQNLTNDSFSIFLEQLGELDHLLERVEALRSELHGIADLVASFLDLRNGFALQSLAKESAKENEEVRKLNESMHKLAERSTQDSAAVKVLTILTLIYLPATVVSNFFSTSFVNSVSSPTAPAHISVSNDWWIFVAASLPLTLLTLYIWFFWTRIQAYGKYPWWWLSRRPAVADNHVDLALATVREGRV